MNVMEQSRLLMRAKKKNRSIIERASLNKQEKYTLNAMYISMDITRCHIVSTY